MNAIGSRLPADVRARRLRLGPLRIGPVNGLLGAALVAAGVGSYLVVGASAPTGNTVRTATVARGVVLSTVSATGALQAPMQLAVDFQSSGVLTSVRVKPGDHVAKGSVLGAIDATTARQSVAQAESALRSAQAQLQETRTGETAQQRAQDAISVQQQRAAIANAKTALAQAKRSATLDAKSDALTQAQAQAQLRTDLGQEKVDVARYKADVTSYGSLEAVTAAIANDKQVLAAAQAQQQADQQTQYTLQEAQTTDNNKLSTDQTTLGNAKATGNAGAISSATDAIAADQTVLNQDAASLTAAQKQLSLDATAIGNAQSKLSDDQSAQTALTDDQNAIRSDEQALVKDRDTIAGARTSRSSSAFKDAQSVQSARQQLAGARLSLRSTLAGNAVKQTPTPSAIASAEAGVVQARAGLVNARKTLAQTVLRAPAAGVVSSVDGTVGAAVAGGGISVLSASSSSSGTGSSGSSGGSGFVTLTDLHGMQLVASFAETDAVKLSPGQAATVTVDALPSDELAAHILSIAQTASSSSGVVTYDVTFALDRTVARLKPGMTANVDVVVGEADNVLHVPTAAVRGSGANATVTVLRNGKQVSVPVVAGLQGDSSTAIVGGGLKAGDQVVLPSVTIASTGAGGLGTSTTSVTTGGAGAGGRFRGGGGFFGGGFGG